MSTQITSITFFPVHSRVYYMRDNRVTTGKVTKISACITDNNADITYTLKREMPHSWDPEEHDQVESSLIESTRDLLIKKL